MKRLLLFLLFLAPLFSAAQKKQGQQLVDSLLHLLPSLSNDTNKAKVLYDISYGYHSNNADEGIKYGEKMLTLSVDLDWDKGIAMADGMLGLNYVSKCDYPKALEYMFKALTINEKIGYLKGQAVNNLNIGVVYMKKGDFKEALSYYGKSKSLYEQLKDSKGVAMNLNNISIIYQQQGNYPKALECYFIALNIAVEMGDKTQEATENGNLGVVYFAQKDYAKALAYDFKALQMGEELGNKSLMTDNLGNIGVCYRNIADETTLYLKGDSLIPVGKTTNLQRSVEYFTKAIDLGKEIGYLDAIQEFYSGLSETYTLLGDQGKALQSYKQYVAIKDSIVTAEDKLKIAGLENKRELDMKDKELEIAMLKVANTRNERIIYISGLVLLLAVIAVVVRRSLKHKKSNTVLSDEKRKYLQHIKVQEDVLKNMSHVQSHDLRGPVATILGLSKLYDEANPDDPDNKVIIKDITSVAEKLDKLITSMIKRENKLSTNMQDTEGNGQ